MSTHDPVNHPRHYGSHPSGIECIDFTEQMGFNLGNAFKYLWRRDQKIDAIEDMKKARWYLSREIKRLKRAMLEQRAHFEAWSMHEPESELKQAMAEIFIGAHLATERMNAIREAIALIDGELHKRGAA